ncbi:hypothetical protein KSW81_006009 [Nannochloris sp. 'desiccata']|nr:hypothetical protein KSW81_006009 [Chlorella desiccata (nom. nud.)]
MNAIHRITGAHQPAVTTAVVLPYDSIAAAIDSVIQSEVDNEKMQHPSGTLRVFQSALPRLIAIQLCVPAEQRPVADPHANINIKYETLPDVEARCNGGNAWKLLVEKWRRFAHPKKRVAAVQKNAQAKLITVAEIKQVQAVALMSPLRELDAILLSVAGLSFLMSRGNCSEILPHLKFFGMKLTAHQKHDGTTRRLLGFSLHAQLKHDSGSMLRDLAMLQHRDPLLDTHGHLAFVDLSYNYLYGWAHGRDILAHISCMLHGTVAAAQAAGVYRESEPALAPESDPLGWLEYAFLAKGKATEVKIGQITSSLRSLLKEAELRKVVVGHLGRNSLCTTLLSEDVSSYQTATLMGWNLNDQMQRSYASKTSIAALPALEAAAGFAQGEVYTVPRTRVDPLQLCPNVYQLFVQAWMVRLREQVGKYVQQAAEYEGARDYLLAREHMIQLLLQNLAFYVFEYGAYCALFRLQAFWAIAGFENGGWEAAASNHPLLDKFQIFAKHVLVAHYGESSLAELLAVQKTMMEGNAFPVPCPLLASELPYASEDAKMCGQAFVRVVKTSYAEAIDELLKMPSRASQCHSEQASGSSSEQMQLVGEFREEVIRSQRQVIELQQLLLQQRAAPWPPQALYGAFPYDQWPPAAYVPTHFLALAAPVQDVAALGGNGLSRLLVSLDKVESFAELQARWPVVQRALASTPLDAEAKERTGRTVSLWQRVFNGVRRCFDGWPDADVSGFMDGLRAGVTCI